MESTVVWNIWQLNGKLLYSLRGHMAIEWIVTLLWWGTNDNCMQSTLVGNIWPLSGPFLLLSFGIYDNWVESYYTVVGETYDNWMGSLLLSRGTYDTDTVIYMFLHIYVYTYKHTQLPAEDGQPTTRAWTLYLYRKSASNETKAEKGDCTKFVAHSLEDVTINSSPCWLSVIC